MATKQWTAAAPAVSQQNQITVGGTPALSQIYTVTVGSGTNVVSVSYTASGTDTNTSIAAALQALLAASLLPQLQDIIWTNPSAGVVVGTAATAGVPFTQTSSASGTGTLTTQAGIAQPVISSVVDSGSGGTLHFNTTYAYRVSALNACGETTASAEVTVTTANDASNTHKATVNWTAPAGTGITAYNVYGRTSGTEQLLATVGSTATSYVDTGSVTPSGALPLANTTVNSGPNDVAHPLNYSTGALPVNGDDLYIVNTSQGLLYNLSALSGVTLNSCTLDSSFTGTIGLPQNNPNGYVEYRPTYLQVGVTTFTINTGTGGGSGRIKVNFGSVQVNATIASAGSASATDQGTPAVILLGTNASNVLTVNQGTVGSAIYPGETSQWATVNLGHLTSSRTDSQVTLGTGCTLGTVHQNGGSLTVNSNVTTVTQNDGTLTVLGAAAVTTLSLLGGRCYYQSTGTVTTASVDDGATLDFTRDPRARTVTNCTVYGGGSLLDPYQTVTWTNPVFFPSGLGAPGGATLDWGNSFHLQRS